MGNRRHEEDREFSRRDPSPRRDHPNRPETVGPALQPGQVVGPYDGEVKRLVADKGFGFILVQGTEVFFHRSLLRGTEFDNLREGSPVVVTYGLSPKGYRAETVEVV